MAKDGGGPTVVFLGSTLPLPAARSLLDADYRPPARFGDVYGLLGGETRTVVLIDGVFHGHAPVWQREILCAIENGITVYGASSMGALRAAELSSLGMIGIGRVFRAYESGEIDGDDEVALLHAGPEHGYRPLSVPLVNLRFTLEEAVKRGVLGPAQAAEIVGAMKALPFWERTMPTFWNAVCRASLERPLQDELRAFFATSALDVKQADAASALAEVARRCAEPRPAARTSDDGPSVHDRHRLLRRSIPAPDRPDREGRHIVDRVLSDRGRHRALRSLLAAQFFALEWARGAGIRIPESERPALLAAHRRRAGASDIDAWRRDNRLTEAERLELLESHLLWRWLLSEAPARFGLAHLVCEGAFPAGSLDTTRCEPLFERTDLLRSLPPVAAFCQSNGITAGEAGSRAPPGPWTAALSGPLRDAVWAIEKGPVHFGFTTWSLSTRLLSELQITGTLRRFAGDPGGEIP